MSNHYPGLWVLFHCPYHRPVQSPSHVSNELMQVQQFLLAAIKLKPKLFHQIISLRKERVSNLKDFVVAAVQWNWKYIKTGLGVFETDRDVVALRREVLTVNTMLLVSSSAVAAVRHGEL